MRRLLAVILSGLCCTSCSAAAPDSPDALVRSVQRMLDAGDIKAASALLDLPNAPAQLRFSFLDTVSECAREATCIAARRALTEADRKDYEAEAKAGELALPAMEGLLTIESKAKDGSGSGHLQAPYGRIDGHYRLLSLQHTPELLARLHARSSESLLQELLADGIYDDETRTHRKDWATIATALPGDGGDAGKALVKYTRGLSAAVDANDPDAAVRAGGTMEQILYGDKDWSGKPVPLAQRQRKLELQGLRMLRDVEVRGGYAYGRDAALVVDARNGVGWIERGAVLMTRDGEEWTISGRKTISYPEPAGQQERGR